MAERLELIFIGTDKTGAAFNSVKGSLTGLSGSLNSLKNSFSNIGRSFDSMLVTGIKVGAVTAVGALTAVGAASLKTASNFEQSRISFETMLGSGEKAGKLMSQIVDFAAKTPFELPQVIEGSRQLLAYGFAQDEVLGGMKMLGNIASGLSIPMGDLIYLYGTLKAQGRAYTRDIMQFAMRGIPIYDLLAQTLGVSKDKVGDLVEAGKVGFPEVQKALSSLGGEGGKWGDLMDKQSKSLQGVWSNLKDQATKTFLAIAGVSVTGDVIEGGLFSRLKKVAEDLLNWINAHQKDIETWITNAVNAIVTWVPQAIDWIKRLVDFFQTGLGKTVLAIIGVLVVTILAAAGSIVSAFALISGVIVAVYMVWANYFGLLKDLWNLMVTQFQLVVLQWKVVFNDLRANLLIIWNYITAVFTGIVNTIVEKFNAAKAFVTATWLNIRNTIMSAVMSAYSFVQSNLAAIVGRFQWLAGAIGSALGGVSGAVRGAWNGVISAAKSGINAFIDVINRGIRAMNKVPKVSIPEIPHLAEGGIVTSPTFALIGEKGPEAVVPLSGGKASAGVGSPTININIHAANVIASEMTIREFAEKIGKQLGRLQEAKGITNSFDFIGGTR